MLCEVVGGVDVEDFGVADAGVRKRPQVDPPQRHHVRLHNNHRTAPTITACNAPFTGGQARQGSGTGAPAHGAAEPQNECQEMQAL